MGGCASGSCGAERVKSHLGLGEVPDFFSLGDAQLAQARGLLDAVVESGGAGGAVAHCLQVLAGDGLQGTWKRHPVWIVSCSLSACLQPLPLTSRRCWGGGRWWKGPRAPLAIKLGGRGSCPYPPGQTVRLCFLARLMSGSLWALTRKKCPGDRFSPSHRSKAKPPSRGPAESTELGIHGGGQRGLQLPVNLARFGPGCCVMGLVSAWAAQGSLPVMSPPGASPCLRLGVMPGGRGTSALPYLGARRG